MSLSDLLSTDNAVALAAQRATPKTWGASAVEEGDKLEATTSPVEQGDTVDEAWMLADRGYDPELWRIVGAIRNSSWDVQAKGGEQKRFTAYRFNAVRRGAPGADIDELIQLINTAPACKALAPAAIVGYPPAAWVHALGDLQLGKSDGDGTEGIVKRVMESIDSGAHAYYELPATSRPKHVHLAFLGDCIEGFVSQGGRNAWRTELTVTEQVRVLRRLMLYAIDAYAPLAARVTVVSVPGNHDEAMRMPVSTRSDDSWAVDALVAVSDAIKLNPAAYGHVECYVPGPDEQDVTMEVGGCVVTHIHGHQHRQGKHWDWWKGQAFGGQQAGLATLLLAGHEHHFQIDTKGNRIRVCVPAFELESTWWRLRTGEVGQPGGLAFIIRDGVPNGFTIR